MRQPKNDVNITKENMRNWRKSRVQGRTSKRLKGEGNQKLAEVIRALGAVITLEKWSVMVKFRVRVVCGVKKLLYICF